MKSDEFTVKVMKHNKPSTRRGVLSIISSVYDPLGFVAPVVLTAKKMLQDLCEKGIGSFLPFFSVHFLAQTMFINVFAVFSTGFAQECFACVRKLKFHKEKVRIFKRILS